MIRLVMIRLSRVRNDWVINDRDRNDSELELIGSSFAYSKKFSLKLYPLQQLTFMGKIDCVISFVVLPSPSKFNS